MKTKKITPLNDYKLRPLERLVLHEILKGNLRAKYLGGEKLGEILNVSPSTVRYTLQRLDDKGYILYIRPKGKKYNLICVNNSTFKRYEITEIKENKITKDEYFNDYCEAQRQELQDININYELKDKFNKLYDSLGN